MDASTLTYYFQQYGIIVIFIIIFLEHLNLPGFPAAVIMPLVGIWASKSGGSLIEVLIIADVAGVLGSCILYFIGRLGGKFIIKIIEKKLPKYKSHIDKTIDMLQRKGFIGNLVSKLIPMISTISPIPAGLIKLNFFSYLLSSAIGIAIWNGVLICGGYFCGEKFIFS